MGRAVPSRGAVWSAPPSSRAGLLRRMRCKRQPTQLPRAQWATLCMLPTPAGTKDPSLSPSARLARWRSQQPGAAASAVPSVVGACGELAAPAQRILAALGELSPQDVAQLEAAVRGQG